MISNRMHAVPEAQELSAPLIAADVGGTHARLARAVAESAGHRIEVLDPHCYACADYPSLAAILKDYAGRTGLGRGARAAVAIAGVPEGDGLLHANLPWAVSVPATREAAGLGALALVNDFEATAWAIPTIDPSDAPLIAGPDGVAPGAGPVLLVGPGTGLGAAVHLPGPPARVIATEAGHAALAAGNGRELAVLGRLLQRWSHVDNERVLSGPGLVNLYAALCALDRVLPRLDSPAAIVAAAAAATVEDPQALEALQMFCALLGSMVGDLALTFGAREVYLAGGISARILPFLQTGGFAARFRNKGVMGRMLERVPVRVVEHGQLGLLGAALWYRQTR